MVNNGRSKTRRSDDGRNPTPAYHHEEQMMKKDAREQPVFYCPKHGVTNMILEVWGPKRVSKSFCTMCYMEFLEKNVTELPHFNTKKELDFHLHKEKMINGDPKDIK